MQSLLKKGCNSVAVGREGWLFAGSDVGRRGGQSWVAGTLRKIKCGAGRNFVTGCKIRQNYFMIRWAYLKIPMMYLLNLEGIELQKLIFAFTY
jgi:hypothetical protein